MNISHGLERGPEFLSIYLYHMAHKYVIYVIFLNAKRVSLKWSLEVVLINYTSFCQLQLFFKVQVHSIRLETKLILKEKVTHECDVFMNTMIHLELHRHIKSIRTLGWVNLDFVINYLSTPRSNELCPREHHLIPSKAPIPQTMDFKSTLNDCLNGFAPKVTTGREQRC
jgi:hypothetical protein